MLLYFGFAEPFPGNGICSLTVVFGRCLAVPVLTNSPVFALRSPILLCGFLLINELSFVAPVAAWALHMPECGNLLEFLLSDDRRKIAQKRFTTHRLGPSRQDRKHESAVLVELNHGPTESAFQPASRPTCNPSWTFINATIFLPHNARRAVDSNDAGFVARGHPVFAGKFCRKSRKQISNPFSRDGFCLFPRAVFFQREIFRVHLALAHHASHDRLLLIIPCEIHRTPEILTPVAASVGLGASGLSRCRRRNPR